MDGPELRATLNGGLGMVAVVPPAGEGLDHRLAGRARGCRPGWSARSSRPTSSMGLVTETDDSSGVRDGEGSARWLSAKIVAVGVSGLGSNLRALVAAERRGVLGGRIGLVFADRPCAALDWAAGEGIPPRSCRAATMPRSRRRSTRRRPVRSRWRATCAWSVPSSSSDTPGGSSTSTRRCCRPFPVPTPSRTRWLLA